MKFPSFDLSPGALLIGAGAALLTPLVLPAAASLLRSTTKFGIKTAMIGYGTGKKLVTDATSAISDVTSEAKSGVFNKPKQKAKKAAASS